MNVLIIYGGKSCENEISVITGCLATSYFLGNVFCVYFDKNNKCYLTNGLSPQQHKSAKFRYEVVFLFGERKIALVRKGRIAKTVNLDVAVNCCHGVCGEDGTVAALCKLTGVPLVGSDIAASAIAMDKELCKIMLRAKRFPVLPSVTLFKNDNVDLSEIKLPVVVKPCNLGSSIGVAVCHTTEQLGRALDVAFCYDNKVLCENALLDFSEPNCSAMRVNGQIQTSRVDLPVASGEMLSFDDKYIGERKTNVCNTLCDLSLSDKVRKLTEKIYDALGFSGVVRVDFLLNKTNGKLYVNEINSIPGSLAYGLWQDKYSRSEFGRLLTEQALADRSEQNKLVFDYVSDVLSGKISKK